MAWKIVERKLGKAGNFKQRQNRQRAWTQKYGDNWVIGYVWKGEFIMQEEALEVVYYQSYKAHFDEHPEDLTELIETAKVLQNPHSKLTGGVDLQVPAILQYLERHDLMLMGNEVVDIGSFGNRSHKISVRLSPLTIKTVDYPKLTLEQFWQKKKCLAVWKEE
ncbi:MAG: hypothetical protein ACPG49_02585 [Chitinophagales bacterium]